MDSHDTFFAACRSGSLEDVRTHIRGGGDVDVRDDRGRTGLAVAVRHENAEVARLLVRHGADVNAVNVNGTTVFMYAKTPAFESGRRDMLAWLLEVGAGLNTRDRFGLTVLDYVREEGDSEMAVWMAARGARSSEDLARSSQDL